MIDAEAIEALIAAAAPEFRLEFTLMGHLAMRWGEALGVGVGHLKDGKVLVRQQVIEDRTTKPCSMTISNYGGKTKHARRDLWASEAILEASQAAYERCAGPTRTGCCAHPHRAALPIQQLAPPGVAAGAAPRRPGGQRPDPARAAPLAAVDHGRDRPDHPRRPLEVRGARQRRVHADPLRRPLSSAGIRPELYLGTQAAS